jgi:hypothetical protein
MQIFRCTSALGDLVEKITPKVSPEVGMPLRRLHARIVVVAVARYHTRAVRNYRGVSSGAQSRSAGTDPSLAPFPRNKVLARARRSTTVEITWRPGHSELLAACTKA